MTTPPPDGSNEDAESAGGESLLTVLLALAANALVAVMKLVAGLVTGSGAMLSEAAHSFGDCSTEIFLLTALRRSSKPADRRHPFGYGKARYFWSLIAAGMIFLLGGVFSAYQGIETIAHRGSEEPGGLLLPLLVLGGAAILEGTSLAQGLRQARSSASHRQLSLVEAVRDPEDPTLKSVVLEDSAAIIGIVLAATGVTLHHATDDALYDGLASLAISLLLVGVAFALTRTCAGLLIGRQADPRLLAEIVRRVETQDEVLDVVDVLTMQLGTDRILLCMRVDFIDTYTAGDLELACVRMVGELEAAFPELAETFIEPVPRTDAMLRERVRSRYGRVLADEPGPDG